ncbi:MAG: ribonuclease J [Anaerolineae bacterium]|nr:ribonuclease J [Anaerolineae bacterium]
MKTLRIIPLGGLGEIGKNCTVLEYGENILVIDAGLMFPEDDMLGVDFVIPDFRYLLEHKERIRGIILTHGHEDHIGALPYLLKEISAPVYATPLTRGLVEGKLRSHGLLHQATLYTIVPGQEVKLGPFSIVPFHVNHSIPDSVGLAIRTPLGLIVHTGDFKIDHTPIEGKTTDLGALARLANEGVIILLADSTNAESPGYTASESELIEAFQRVFAKAQGRIIVATFASLLSRIQLVIETAAQFGRRVAIAGRSMEDNIRIAEELGYIHFPPNTRIPLGQISKLPDDQICVLATGSQGEPTAALARMASGKFRHLKIKEGDTVVLSSKAIPGNETQIYRNIDNLFRQGANVVYGEQAGLHVSGHAAQEELKLMLNLLRPLYFVPLHGAYRMLQTHARLAYELGFPKEDVFVLDNGDCLELNTQGARRGESVPVQNVFVDGSLVGDVGDTILRDRMALSRDGFVIARVTLEPKTGQLRETPEIISHGFIYVPESGDILQSAESAIVDIVERYSAQDCDTEELSKQIKQRLEELFYDETRRRPVIIPLVSTTT